MYFGAHPCTVPTFTYSSTPNPYTSLFLLSSLETFTYAMFFCFIARTTLSSYEPIARERWKGLPENTVLLDRCLLKWKVWWLIRTQESQQRCTHTMLTGKVESTNLCSRYCMHFCGLNISVFKKYRNYKIFSLSLPVMSA